MCERCGLGLVLVAAEALAPAPGDPFLVVDATLAVRAVGRAAEALVAPADGHSGLTAAAVLVAAGVTSLPTLVARAVAGATLPAAAVVRPRDGSPCRRATLGPCGPPAAALVVLGEEVPSCARKGPVCRDGCASCTGTPGARYIVP